MVCFYNQKKSCAGHNKHNFVLLLCERRAAQSPVLHGSSEVHDHLSSKVGSPLSWPWICCLAKYSTESKGQLSSARTLCALSTALVTLCMSRSHCDLFPGSGRLRQSLILPSEAYLYLQCAGPFWVPNGLLIHKFKRQLKPSKELTFLTLPPKTSGIFHN